ncbi:MAG: hypothetical protein ACYTFO_03750, partial [Planctomycetota bacterium]
TSADFRVENFPDQQIVYQVILVDRQGDPLPAKGSSYRTDGGAVGAARSMIVFRSPQVFQKQTVSIPADAVIWPADGGPTYVYMSVFSADGQRLAIVSCPVFPGPGARQVASQQPGGPIASAEPTARDQSPWFLPQQIQSPPSDEPDQPDEPEVEVEPTGASYWFLRLTDPNDIPSLLGPYESAGQAVELAPAVPCRPLVIADDQTVWMIDIAVDGGAISHRMGPFWTDADALKAAQMFVARVAEDGQAASPQPPQGMNLATYLARYAPAAYE